MCHTASSLLLLCNIILKMYENLLHKERKTCLKQLYSKRPKLLFTHYLRIHYFPLLCLLQTGILTYSLGEDAAKHHHCYSSKKCSLNKQDLWHLTYCPTSLVHNHNPETALKLPGKRSTPAVPLQCVLLHQQSPPTALCRRHSWPPVGCVQWGCSTGAAVTPRDVEQHPQGGYPEGQL